MNTSLVLTIIGPDRPGLVELVSESVAAHEGSWQESRMARLAGHFAGILRVSVPTPRREALTLELDALGDRGLRVIVELADEAESPSEAARALQLDLVGQDRPGIVRDISRAMAKRSVNVEALETECSSAPMSGEPLFRATAKLRVPSDVAIDDLREILEDLADDLMVDIRLDEAEQS